MTLYTLDRTAPPSPAAARTAVTLVADDGYRLGAEHYAARAPSRGSIVVAGATAVPQAFYRRFAEYASARGYDTLTLDYRGIGRSAPTQLRGFTMEYLDWARRDLAAAIDSMRNPDLPLFLVGHSFGGHAYGLLPNVSAVTAAYLFGTGAGWHGWMPRREQFKVLLMWRVLGPLLTRWKGYLPWRMLGMGEDLPLGVYRQWRRWCSFPHYFFDDPTMTAVRAEFDRVTAPIVAANALDDLWAPPASRDAFMTGYRNAPWIADDIDPARAGIGPIGHMGYFRAAAAPLWQRALDWFEQQADVAVRSS